MTRADKVQAVDRAYALIRLDDARAYLAQAVVTLQLTDVTRHSAAASSSAVQAGIAAGDAACALRLGVVSRGTHTQAPVLLASVPGGKAAAGKLRRLVRSKNEVQYLATHITEGNARSAIEQARVVLAFAETLL